MSINFIGSLPESLTQELLVRKLLVGGLSVQPISLIRFPLFRSRPWRNLNLPLWPLRYARDCRIRFPSSRQIFVSNRDPQILSTKVLSKKLPVVRFILLSVSLYVACPGLIKCPSILTPARRAVPGAYYKHTC